MNTHMMTDSGSNNNLPGHGAAPDSICLLRLSALGDVCNTVPLARALQAAWPEARLTWIIGRLEHRLIEDLPGVEFIVYDKRSGLAGLRVLRRQLGGHRFDLLLLAQVSQRASMVASVIRARRRIGFDRPRSRLGHGLFINERIQAVPFQHQALAFLEFARHLGLPTAAVDRSLPIPEAARSFALEHQPQARQAVLISPASSHPLRNWTTEGYAEVADWIIEKAGRPVILVGGPSALERELGQKIEAAMRNKPLNLIGQDTLKQALAMLERAAVLITPDSGPAHFAAALGTPVAGLHAATWARRSGPLGSLEHTVDQFPAAAREFRRSAPEELRWGTRLEMPGVMELITPAMVIDKLRPLLLDTGPSA